MKTRTLALALTGGALTAAMLAPVAAQAGPGPDFVGYVQYGDDPDYTVSFTSGSATWAAPDGVPNGMTFADNGDDSGTLSGQAEVAPGVYDIHLTATTETPTTFDYILELTVKRERAVVQLASTNPAKVSRTKSFTLKARVQDQDDDAPGDITKAGVGNFSLTRKGHTKTYAASLVPNSLHTKAPAYYDVKAKIPSGLHRGTWTVTYTVVGDYYVGSRSSSIRITR